MNKMEESIKIDMAGYEEQRREEIRKKGRYAEVTVTVERIEDLSTPSIPVVNIKSCDVNSYTDLVVITALKEAIKAIREQDPAVILLEKITGTKITDVGSFKKELKDNE